MEDDPHKSNEELVAELESSRQRLGNLNQMVKGRENEDVRSEQLGDLSRVYREAPIGLCCLDTDLRFLQINDWLAAIDGLSVEDHLGRTIGEVLPNVAEGVGAQFRHVIETGEPVIDGTVIAETPAQPSITRTFEHCYIPIRSDDGTVMGISCVVQDVTERKQTERALQEARDELELRVRVQTKELREANEALHNLSARLFHAQEEERSRIARELHDDFKQRLALMNLDIEQLARGATESPEDFDQGLHGLLGCIKELSSDVHRLSHQLHPTTLVHLGLVSSVKSLCRELSALHGLQIEIADQEVPKAVPNDVALCLYGIVQEALRNVIKHSGARKARVELTRTREGLVLRVRDWGVGFDVAAVKGERGLGLISMGERLRLVGGQIAVESSEARGTQIEVLVPLPRADAGDGNR